MKKVDLMGSDGGALKMTCRAVITALSSMLGMEIIYSKSDREEKKQKTYIKDMYSFLQHVLTINDIRNDNQCQ